MPPAVTRHLVQNKRKKSDSLSCFKIMFKLICRETVLGPSELISPKCLNISSFKKTSPILEVGIWDKMICLKLCSFESAAVSFLFNSHSVSVSGLICIQ